MKLTLHFFFVL